MVGGDGSEGGDDGVGKFLCASGAANVAGDVAVLAVDALDGCRRDPAQDRSATKRGRSHDTTEMFSKTIQNSPNLR
jgi:hypothetical protein